MPVNRSGLPGEDRRVRRPWRSTDGSRGAVAAAQVRVSDEKGRTLSLRGTMNAPQRLSTLDYLVEVAKDWTLSRFAAAENSDFAIAPHRFELDGHTVRRSGIPRRSREAASPLQAVGRPAHPIAWARSEVVTFLADTEYDTVEFQQEIV